MQVVSNRGVFGNSENNFSTFTNFLKIFILFSEIQNENSWSKANMFLQFTFIIYFRNGNRKW